MSFTPDPVTRTCPQCGAVNPRRAASCWLCYADLDAPGPHPERLRPPADATHRPLALLTGGFLAGLVLLITLGILLNAEGPWRLFALLFLLAATPALVHVFRAGASGEPSRPLGALQVLGAVVASVGAAALVVLAAAVTFVATCFPVGLATFDRGGGTGIALAFVLGILGAGAGAYLVALAVFRRRARRP